MWSMGSRVVWSVGTKELVPVRGAVRDRAHGYKRSRVALSCLEGEGLLGGNEWTTDEDIFKQVRPWEVTLGQRR